MFKCCINCEKRKPACSDRCVDFLEIKKKADLIRRERNKNLATQMKFANSNSKAGRGRW